MGVVCIVSMAVNAESRYYLSLSGPDKKRYAVKVEDFANIKYCKSIDPYEIKECVDDVELWPNWNSVTSTCTLASLMGRVSTCTLRKL